MNPDNEVDAAVFRTNAKALQVDTEDDTSTKDKLRAAIRGSNEVLFCAKTVFPIVLFPDTVIVDREKVTITKRAFFKTAEVMSIRFEDILNATASVGPMFGSVKIMSRVLNNNEKPYAVNNFWRDDALRLKRIIQGYAISIEKKIDCSKLDSAELTKLLEDLGADNHSTTRINT